MAPQDTHVEPRVLQFGTGVFVRGFFDWMLQEARNADKWQGSVIGVKLTPDGALPQSCSHTHIMRGMQNGCQIEKHSVLSVVDKYLNPYRENDLTELLASASIPGLDIVVSNSTEAGICYSATPRPEAGSCPASFPAKLLMWLHARFQADPKLGVTVLPLELIEDNGVKLKDIVKRHAEDWALGSDFGNWLEQHCDFRSTLVDRIVTKPGAQEDPMMTISEPYHLLAVSGDASLEERLPLLASGLNVIYTTDLDEYRTRKVRVLNGAHHVITFLGLAMGKVNVLDCVDDAVLGEFLEGVLLREVLPTLGSSKGLEEYVATVLERFRNPWLDHRLEAIAMNSASKVLVRLLPSISDYVRQFDKMPVGLVLAVAAFLAYEGPVKGCEKEPVLEACSAELKEAAQNAATQLKNAPPEVAMRASNLLCSSNTASRKQKSSVEFERDAKSSADFDVSPQKRGARLLSLPSLMRRCVLQEPGRFEQLQVETPPAPAPGWAIIKIGAVGMCGTDFHAYHGSQNFFTYPRVLGHEIGATVVALGDISGSSPVQVGDQCSVVPYWGCGSCVACANGKPNCCESISVIGVHAHGAMQEYLAVPVDKLVPSKSLPLEQLALVESLCIGAHAVNRGQPRNGENVLVIGAGPIGMATAQFAKAEDTTVAIMDINDSRLNFAKGATGVDHTINSQTSDDVIAALKSAFGGQLPTLVFDATGNIHSMQNAFQMVAHGGKLVFVGHTKTKISFDNPLFHAREMTILGSRNALREDFSRVISLIEEKKVDISSWITHRCTLDTFEHDFLEWLKPETGVIKGIVKM